MHHACSFVPSIQITEGIALNSFIFPSVLLQALARLSCAFKIENKTRLVVCDLGNPMKARTKVRLSRVGSWGFKDK